MSWRCFMVDEPDWSLDAPIGAMWLVDPPRERDGVPVWCVVLPGANNRFCLDTKSTATNGYWQCSGAPPNVTVHPSINVVGVYHGWIRDGVISDDVEGRTFDE